MYNISSYFHNFYTQSQNTLGNLPHKHFALPTKNKH